MVSRGDVWLAVLDPTVGNEIQRTRPCLVISPSEINDHLSVVLIAPMTSGSRPAPFRVPAQFGGVDGFILLEQTRALDRHRLIRKLGRIESIVLAQTLQAARDLYED
ncbi:type II toxin-antitoxin system PemK/MazF family toxin [uncultured Devosia sp.]|uniref:type II toxin-antitoxin system PemK/MazF family toxin n=1 Tax=uncultured Devosia sp. TaxID=211434 RepID=UPI0035CC307A